MSSTLIISNFLNEVYNDWLATRGDYPHNTHPADHWPVPFFGNPATALAATVGVNPSSEEFAAARRWPKPVIENRGTWKKRLKSYFSNSVEADDWFDPWQVGLSVLGLSYGEGTAAHMDVSYRPTKAMLKNPNTDRIEFRRMVETDVRWLFKLLLLCPNLRLLLTFGPIVGLGGQVEQLSSFLFAAALQHGFRMIPDGKFWLLWHEPTRRVFTIHDADNKDEKCLTCRVVKNLYEHRDELKTRLQAADSK